MTLDTSVSVQASRIKYSLILSENIMFFRILQNRKLQYILISVIVLTLLTHINMLLQNNGLHLSIRNNVVNEDLFHSNHVRSLINTKKPKTKSLKKITHGIGLDCIYELPSDAVDLLRHFKVVGIQVDKLILMNVEHQSCQQEMLETAPVLKWGLLRNEPDTSFILNQMWRTVRKQVTSWRVETSLHQYEFISKSGLQMFISMIYERTNFYYVEKILSIEEPARAYSKFTVKQVTFAQMKGISFLLPDERFIWEHPHSRFLPCNGQVNKAFNDGNNNAEYLITKDDFRGAVKARDILYSYNMPVMLFSGTLLGWVRNCDIIPNTTDFDLTLHQKYFNQLIIQEFACHNNFGVIQQLGKRNESLEITVWFNESLQIDIFLLYQDQDLSKTHVTNFNIDSRLMYKFYYPPIPELCTAELRDHLFFVPCNADQVIKWDYGLNWFHPDDDYQYLATPLNYKAQPRLSLVELSQLIKHPTCEDHSIVI